MLKYTEENYIDPEVPVNPFRVEALSQVSPEHTHDFYEFFVIEAGSCRHVVNGETQLLQAGCLVFIRPEDIHRYEQNGEEDCRFYNVPCRHSLMDEAMAFLGEEEIAERLLQSHLPQVALLSPTEVGEFVALFERIKLLSSIDKQKARLVLKSGLIDLLTRYFFNPNPVKQEEIPLWLEHALSKMQLKENLHRGLPALYELSGRSIGHVNRAFRRYLQQTPTEYLNQLKLSAARNLLLTTELRVVEIALECGFENVSHFYHQFKKWYHQAPLDLRRNRQAIPVSTASPGATRRPD
ncbi:helix-turn-helix domain-containing protein [Paenibacillus phoenicis]|uniref:Helix-turn-helix domain-containing protein n=1 Tax=Paenibacillus phoenicis TaxID=554117 RepID=A0ABU5PEY4_9BACL|nr:MULTISPECIES: helix-turn-helix domain-containing protein [Paenibacillus]EES73599.1 AraC-like ligand binding domain protein [Paenibacillus sp. oral taxon 786 str. D14]MEA3568420.1 helix-turn-helix domain-containing protein [Paenibacillus phoenicis]